MTHKGNPFYKEEMVHYSRKPTVSAKAAKAKISDLRCHFKNTFETANVIQGQTYFVAVALDKNLNFDEASVVYARNCAVKVTPGGGAG